MSEQTIAFIESARELEAVQTWTARSGEKPLIVVRSPEAQYETERRGIPHRSIEELYPEERLLRLGEENFERAEHLGSLLQNHHFDEDASRSPRLMFPPHPLFFALKRLLDNLLFCSMPLRSALRTLQATRVFGFAYPHRPPSDALWFAHESLPQRILAFAASSWNCDWLPLRPDSPRTRTSTLGTPSLRDRYDAWTQRIHLGRDLRSFLQSLNPVRNRRRSASPLTGPRILIAQSSPDLESLRPFLQRAGFDVLDLGTILRDRPQPLTPGELSRFGRGWNRVANDESVRRCFDVEGVNLFPLVRSRLKHLLLGMGPWYHRRLRQVRAPVQRLDLSAVMTSLPSTDVTILACLAASRDLGVPVVSHQHGGFVGYFDFPILRYGDLGPMVDSFFCFGSGVAQSLRHGAPLPGRPAEHVPELRPVGSPRIARLHAQLRGGAPAPPRTRRPRVVYSPTMFCGNLRYFTWHILPDLRYWELVKTIIRCCASFTDIDLLVKSYPRNTNFREWPDGPLEPWLRDQNLPNCTLRTDVPFSAVLAQGDLFVLDSPTTMLLEAIATTKPVVLFVDPKYMHLDPQARGLLERRVDLCLDEQHLQERLRHRIRELDAAGTGAVDDTFLQRYGIHSDASEGAPAVAALRELIARRTPTTPPGPGPSR